MTTRPGYRMIGHRERSVLNVDYADVLRQAVENERYRVLREIRLAVDALRLEEPDPNRQYTTRQRPAKAVKADITAALDRITDHLDGSTT